VIDKNEGFLGVWEGFVGLHDLAETLLCYGDRSGSLVRGRRKNHPVAVLEMPVEVVACLKSADEAVDDGEF
jgi:hypothetical protein